MPPFTATYAAIFAAITLALALGLRARGPHARRRSRVRIRPCLFCGPTACEDWVRAPDFEYACRPGEFTVVHCMTCDHAFLDPLPTQEEIATLYPKTYYTRNPDSPVFLKGIVYWTKLQVDLFRIRDCMRGRGPRSIVDIGCGDAERLFHLRRRIDASIEIIGADLHVTPAVREQAQTAGVRMIQTDVEEDLDFLRESGHDFIVMSQLIEHLRDPMDFLVRLRAKLSGEGCLLIETPNLGGLDYRIFGRRFWGVYHIPRHLHLFSQRSLQELLSRCGYTVLRQGFLGSAGFWTTSLRNLFGLNSARRGRSPLESLNCSNPLVIGAFMLLDLTTLALGGVTSTQYMLVRKTPGCG